MENTFRELSQRQKLFFESGATRSLEFRANGLKKLGMVIERHTEEILDALQRDLGKCPEEGYLTEVGMVRRELSYVLRHFRKWARPKRVMPSLLSFPAKERILPTPYGRVLILAPFNYPFQLVFHPLIAAVAAGNCAVVKPSEFAPHTSAIAERLVAEVFEEAHVACVQGAVEVSSSLLKLPFDYIFFTGSATVGKIVLREAAERLIPVTLELGGKSPVFVDAQTDVAKTAERILWGKMLNAGQTCIAPDYVWVDERVKNELLAALKEQLLRFFGADPQQSPHFGRIVNARHWHRLKALLDADRSYILHGGEADERDRYIAPTLMEIPNSEAAVMQEELFGPLLPLRSYRDVGSAIAETRRGEKPLALYIFSDSAAYQERILQAVSSGGICVNDTMAQLINPGLPFGGVGASGMGISRGKFGFETFSQQRAYLKQRGFHSELHIPPYRKNFLSLLKKVMR